MNGTLVNCPFFIHCLNYPATMQAPNGIQCVLLFNNRELAEHVLSLSGRTASISQIRDLPKFIQDVIEADVTHAIVDYGGGRACAYVELTRILEAIG